MLDCSKYYLYCPKTFSVFDINYPHKFIGLREKEYEFFYIKYVNEIKNIYI